MNKESGIFTIIDLSAAIFLVAYLLIILSRWLHPALFNFTTEITVLSLAIATLAIGRSLNIRNSKF